MVPLLLKGLRDPNVDVNVEADQALRYIARKPGGVGVSNNPLAGAETAQMMPTSELERVVRAAGFTPVERDTLYNAIPGAN